MDEPMEWLIEAIQKKQLIEFSENGEHWRKAEPHMYALGPGGAEIVIIYQLDVGHGTVPNEQLWKIVDASRVVPSKTRRLFSKIRPIPKRYAEQARKVYAQASDAFHKCKGSAPS
jgi:hypothetical protein